MSRMNIATRRVGSWLSIFAAAALGWDNDTDIIDVTVPGPLKANGQVNNRGNVVLAIPAAQVDGIGDELRAQLEGERKLTPAEVIRRSYTEETDDDGEVWCVFRVSEAKSTRSARVLKSNMPTFIDELEVKLASACEFRAQTIADALAAAAEKAAAETETEGEAATTDEGGEAPAE